MPYLTVAIASSGLAGSGGISAGHDVLSPARLLFASGALAAAAGCTSACIFEIQRVTMSLRHCDSLGTSMSIYRDAMQIACMCCTPLMTSAGIYMSCHY